MSEPAKHPNVLNPAKKNRLPPCVRYGSNDQALTAHVSRIESSPDQTLRNTAAAPDAGAAVEGPGAGEAGAASGASDGCPFKAGHSSITTHAAKSSTAAKTTSHVFTSGR